MITRDELDTLRQRMAEMDDVVDKHRSKWNSAAKQFCPERGRDLEKRGRDEETEGDNPYTHLLDPTGLESLRVAAAGLMSGLTPRTRPWFIYKISGDEKVTQRYRVRKHLDMRGEIVRRFQQTTNFYQVMHSTYMELLGFGTGPHAYEATPGGVKPYRCISFTAGEYRLDINGENQVDTFGRRCSWSVKQIIDKWGEGNVPEEVARDFREGHLSRRHKLAHLIEPNDDRMKLPDAVGRPWRSAYWIDDSTSEDAGLGVSGFWHFPIVAPRWDVVGSEVYGETPAFATVGPSGCLQALDRDKLQAIALMVKPPTQGAGKDVDLRPGAHNPTTPGLDPIKAIFEVRPDLAAMLEAQREKQGQVKSLLFADLFLLLASLRPGDMTAYEVAERNSEKLQILGPVLDRLETELLEASIRIQEQILTEQGLLPPLPPELEGAEIVPEYTSILAQAQELVGVRSLREFTGWADAIAEKHPEANDKVNWDEVIDELGERYNVPADIVNDDQIVARKRAQREQMQNAQMQAGMAQAQANTAKTLAEAPLGDGTNVLETMIGSAR